MYEFASTVTSQQVGVSERDGKTLAGTVRYILTGFGLPKFLWGELMQIAAYLANRAPHTALKNVTPNKAIYNKEENLENLRLIRAKDFVHIERYKKKLNPHAWERCFVGYNSNSIFFWINNPRDEAVG